MKICSVAFNAAQTNLIYLILFEGQGNSRHQLLQREADLRHLVPPPQRRSQGCQLVEVIRNFSCSQPGSPNPCPKLEMLARVDNFEDSRQTVYSLVVLCNISFI